MSIKQPINEQIQAILDIEARDEQSQQYVLAEVLKLLKHVRGSDLAGNIKSGPAGDMADNIKSGPAGDMADNIKSGPAGDMADNIKSGPAGDMGLTGESAIGMMEIVALVRAGAALGQAKTILADLRGVLPSLHGEQRARVEKSINFLETALSTVSDSYRKYLEGSTAATAAMRRRASSATGRPVHVHLHLGT
jgi:hypothetical protein